MRSSSNVQVSHFYANRTVLVKTLGPASELLATEAEVQDAALELRVGKTLLGEIGRHALRLEVESTDGVVSLRGKVPDRQRKELALRAAHETPGVKKVIDLIEVRR
mgnify:CR=1 FL=1